MHQVEVLAEAIAMAQTTPHRMPCVCSYQSLYIHIYPAVELTLSPHLGQVIDSYVMVQISQGRHVS